VYPGYEYRYSVSSMELGTAAWTLDTTLDTLYLYSYTGYTVPILIH
jgi:hypothetical protein